MQKKIVSLWIILLLLSSFTSIFLIDEVKASGINIYVDDDNTNGPWDGTIEHPFQYIQDGIDAAAENGTVYVSNGTYRRNIVVDKTINLIGNDKDNTTIDGRGIENVILLSANHVKITGFTIENGTNGIKINASSNNTIRENTITKTDYGIYIDSSSNNNTIYHNNFLNNTQNAYDKGSNTWDNGYPSGGNYWDDYIGVDTDGDGIGDKPYKISGGDNKDMFPLTVPITEQPNANFTYSPSNPTTQDFIQFTDTSTDIDGYITSLSWDFGDGNTSAEKDPTHKYADNGVYIVTLRVTDNYDTSNETSKQIIILNVEPIVDFKYSPLNPTDLQKVDFTDNSIDLDGDIVNWSWDFGDGNTSNLQNSTHQYADNGTYIVTLRVIDDDGATNETSQQIVILNVEPIASFTYSPAEPTINDTIQFSDTSIDRDGTIVTWNWNLGDGTTSTERSPNHNYVGRGTYTVSLTVTDNDGDSGTLTKKITVIDLTIPSEDEEESPVIYIVYIALFVVMIGMVIWLSKKYG